MSKNLTSEASAGLLDRALATGKFVTSVPYERFSLAVWFLLRLQNRRMGGGAAHFRSRV
jgi:hypothetical protein